MDSGGGEEVGTEGERGGWVPIWNEVGIHEQTLRWTVSEGVVFMYMFSFELCCVALPFCCVIVLPCLSRHLWK